MNRSSFIVRVFLRIFAASCVRAFVLVHPRPHLCLAALVSPAAGNSLFGTGAMARIYHRLKARNTAHHPLQPKESFIAKTTPAPHLTFVRRTFEQRCYREGRDLAEAAQLLLLYSTARAAIH